MNLPGVIVNLPTLTDKDKEDLVQWGVKNKVDFIAASFVRKGKDLDNIREVLGDMGDSIHIISKIENQEGIQNFEQVLEKSDGVMVLYSLPELTRACRSLSAVLVEVGAGSAGLHRLCPGAQVSSLVSSSRSSGQYWERLCDSREADSAAYGTCNSHMWPEDLWQACTGTTPRIA